MFSVPVHVSAISEQEHDTHKVDYSGRFKNSENASYTSQVQKRYSLFLRTVSGWTGPELASSLAQARKVVSAEFVAP